MFEIDDGEHHDHMVCTRCSKVIEFTCDEIEDLQDEVCEKFGFQLVFHDHRLFGICKECQEKKRVE